MTGFKKTLISQMQELLQDNISLSASKKVVALGECLERLIAIEEFDKIQDERIAKRLLSE